MNTATNKATEIDTSGNFATLSRGDTAIGNFATTREAMAEMVALSVKHPGATFTIREAYCSDGSRHVRGDRACGRAYATYDVSENAGRHIQVY